jgi:hypothetical protein
MSNGANEGRYWEKGLWGLFDPWSATRLLRDTYLESMAEVMDHFVNTEAYAQATGAMLDSYLSVAAPVREAMDKLMPQLLAFYGLPQRDDVISVATRMTNIETRLDDMEMKLDEIARAVNRGEERGPNIAPVGTAQEQLRR